MLLPTYSMNFGSMLWEFQSGEPDVMKSSPWEDSDEVSLLWYSDINKVWAY
jgi:hypothetical protein